MFKISKKFLEINRNSDVLRFESVKEFRSKQLNWLFLKYKIL